ncbi:hypothetical protein KDA_64890 [Dictyobacter alpinus]|uniref:ABC transmembrane type-1 domain-containing protein n=1 Tax=Dictyobacter alpinus TaxID=2014873 RepID=A0A402BI19_9CHLR|nr:phosphonate ABC transporter, permease protein PhnE [Dictyobacter alpinus]GCE31005.1 hypothetical protein KDA_64890 [Dictyobacter alpinus]
MSIREEEAKTVASTPPRSGMRRQFFQLPEPDLRRPLGAIHWPIAIPALVLLLLAGLLFTRIIDFGSMPFQWTLAFDVNILLSLVILFAGALAIVPGAMKNRQNWRNRTTWISIGVLVLVAIFFFFKLVNLGTFTYTFNGLDINGLCLIVLVALLAALAFKGSKFAGLGLLLLFLWWGISIDGFGLGTFQDIFTSDNGSRLFREMVPPNWSYFANVTTPLFLTVQTAVLATLIGVIGALPLSILAARNTTPHPVIYNIVRLIINTVRAVPALVLAMIFVTILGLGPVAGAFGLGVHSISVLTKLYAEAIESVKLQPIEALSAAGANGLKRFRWGVFPQAFPLLASNSIYYWESNTRDSTVVAFVGGGGLGFILNSNLSLFQYANVSVILISLILTVMLLDRISDFIRSKIM